MCHKQLEPTPEVDIFFCSPQCKECSPENQAPSNAAHATKANQRGAAKSALPLAPNIVRLITHSRRHIRIRAGRNQEDAKVADARVLMKAHDGQANEANDHVEQDHRAAQLPAVAGVAIGVDDERGEDVRRRHQALRRADAEAHVFVQDDGKEVGECVRDGCRSEKHQSVAPDFEVEAGAEEFTCGEGLRFGVAPVRVHSGNDESGLALGEEAP